MKKLLIGIATLMMMAVLCVVSAGAETYGDYTYTVLDNGTVEITYYNGNATELEIPSAIDGKAVTSIGYDAFWYCSSLTSITIPDSITSIGKNAFHYCSSLTSITIPDSVTSIGESAFTGCSSLTSITIPESVTNIGDSAFAYCSSLTTITVDSANGYYATVNGVLFNKSKTALITYPDDKTNTSYVIPESVTSIGNSAFSDCTFLTSITIPDSVTSIGESAFIGCTSLTSVTIPDGVTSIKVYAFRNCTSLESVIIPDSVTSIGTNAFVYCSSLTSITIPDSVTNIGFGAFYGCTSLTSVTLPDSVTIIGSVAFYGCTSLTSVTLPDSVTSIGHKAFNDTPLLDNQTTDVKYVDKWVVDCDTDAEEVIIKDGTKGIAESTFRNCTSLTSITIPDSVTNIGYGAFAYCSSLTSITIPDSVTSIDAYTFGRCTSLTSITIPESVTNIGDSAFDYCSSLTSITIPDSVTSIHFWAFNGCNGLVINCYDNSYAHTYAINHDIDYSIITPPAPSAVTGFNSPSKSTTAIRLSWTKNSNASGYIVEQFNGSSWVQIADITDASTVTYKVTGLVPGTAYKFRMRAYNAGGKSKNTATLTVNTQMTAVKGFTSPSQSTSAIRLNWTKNANADGYVIEQYTSDGWVQIADITDKATTTYKVTGLKSGTAYKFRMKAYSVTKYGDTIYGDKTETLTANTQASAVTGLALKSRSASALRLTWTKNTAVDGYIIEQKIDGKWVQIADIDDYKTTEYKVTGLSASAKYSFRMKAYAITKYGDKTYSGYTSTLSKTTSPANVTGLVIGGRAGTALRLNWDKNTSADGYIIEQYKGGKWTQIADITDNATTTYRIDGLSPATQYKFRVKAYNMVGTTALYSNYTATLAAYTNPSAVSGLKIAGKAGTALRLGWTQNTTADGYIVEQYIDGKWTRIARIAGNETLSYRVENLTKATTYKFRVATYNIEDNVAYYGAYVTISGTTL